MNALALYGNAFLTLQVKAGVNLGPEVGCFVRQDGEVIPVVKIMWATTEEDIAICTRLRAERLAKLRQMRAERAANATTAANPKH